VHHGGLVERLAGGLDAAGPLDPHRTAAVDHHLGHRRVGEQRLQGAEAAEAVEGAGHRLLHDVVRRQRLGPTGDVHQRVAPVVGRQADPPVGIIGHDLPVQPLGQLDRPPPADRRQRGVQAVPSCC
jgi:hypothetical protein